MILNTFFFQYTELNFRTITNFVIVLGFVEKIVNDIPIRFFLKIFENYFYVSLSHFCVFKFHFNSTAKKKYPTTIM